MGLLHIYFSTSRTKVELGEFCEYLREEARGWAYMCMCSMCTVYLYIHTYKPYRRFTRISWKCFRAIWQDNSRCDIVYVVLWLLLYWRIIFMGCLHCFCGGNDGEIFSIYKGTRAWYYYYYYFSYSAVNTFFNPFTRFHVLSSSFSFPKNLMYKIQRDRSNVVIIHLGNRQQLPGGLMRAKL